MLWIVRRPGNRSINLSNPVEVTRDIEQRDWIGGWGHTTGSLLQRLISRNPPSVLWAEEGMRGLWEDLEMEIPHNTASGSHSMFPAMAFKVFDLILYVWPLAKSKGVLS